MPNSCKFKKKNIGFDKSLNHGSECCLTLAAIKTKKNGNFKLSSITSASKNIFTGVKNHRTNFLSGINAKESGRPIRHSGLKSRGYIEEIEIDNKNDKIYKITDEGIRYIKNNEIIMELIEFILVEKNIEPNKLILQLFDISENTINNLQNMGFPDKYKNIALLLKFKGDIEECINILVEDISELVESENELIEQEYELIEQEYELVEQEYELIEQEYELVEHENELVESENELVDNSNEFLEDTDEVMQNQEESKLDENEWTEVEHENWLHIMEDEGEDWLEVLSTIEIYGKTISQK